MEFVDETVIKIRSGDGGDGVVRFRHERNVPLGGPTGGNGGRGGSIRMRATRNVDTLLPVDRTQTYVAKNGEPGGGNARHGADAEDVVIEVPVGTVVYERGPHRAERAIHDLARDGDEVVLAAGGLGGHGNRHFATAVRQAPSEHTLGGEGVGRKLRLELKLLADVGLLGLPNAGKSTLLSRLSAAKPRIADYPFTTLQPQLGIVEDIGGHRQLVLADIPGIIEGAADGAGMGLEFLRHVERCRLLLHVVDLAPLDGAYPWDHWRTINEELARYSPILARRPQLLVGNKLDLTAAEDARQMMEAETGLPVLGLSAVTGAGLKALRKALFAALAKVPAEGDADDPAVPAAEAPPEPARPRRPGGGVKSGRAAKAAFLATPSSAEGEGWEAPDAGDVFDVPFDGIDPFGDDDDVES